MKKNFKMEPNHRFETVLETDKTLQISSKDSNSSKSRRSSFSESSSCIQPSSFSPKSQQIIENQGKMLKILQAQVNELKAMVLEGHSKNEIKTCSNAGFVTPKKSVCPFEVIQNLSGSNNEGTLCQDWFQEKEDLRERRRFLKEAEKEQDDISNNSFNHLKSFKVGTLENFYYDVPRIEYHSLSESESDEQLDAVERKYLCKFLDFNHTLK